MNHPSDNRDRPKIDARQQAEKLRDKDVAFNLYPEKRPSVFGFSPTLTSPPSFARHPMVEPLLDPTDSARAVLPVTISKRLLQRTH